MTNTVLVIGGIALLLLAVASIIGMSKKIELTQTKMMNPPKATKAWGIVIGLLIILAVLVILQQFMKQ